MGMRSEAVVGRGVRTPCWPLRYHEKRLLPECCQSWTNHSAGVRCCSIAGIFTGAPFAVRPCLHAATTVQVTFFWNGNVSGYFNEELETYVEIPSDKVHPCRSACVIRRGALHV